MIDAGCAHMVESSPILIYLPTAKDTRGKDYNRPQSRRLTVNLVSEGKLTRLGLTLDDHVVDRRDDKHQCLCIRCIRIVLRDKSAASFPPRRLAHIPHRSISRGFCSAPHTSPKEMSKPRRSLRLPCTLGMSGLVVTGRAWRETSQSC